MELLVNPVSYKNAIDLIKLNVDCIFVGTKETSVRNACNLSFSQIQSLVKNKNKTKIIILINKFFFDPELEEVEKYILKICSLKIDGIMYSDLCVNQILFEHKIKIKQIYNPEALNVNFGQIDFLKSNNIDEIALARELNKNNIIEILKNKKNMSIQIQVCGYAYMMTSRWDLLTNFKNSHNIKTPLKNKKMFLSEKNRDNEFIIYEGEHGTDILTGYNLFLLEKMEELNKNKLDIIRIDSFLHNEKWVLECSKIFIQAVNFIKKNKKLPTKFISDSKTTMLKFDKFTSKGFYDMNKDDLLYLNANENK